MNQSSNVGEGTMGLMNGTCSDSWSIGMLGETGERLSAKWKKMLKESPLEKIIFMCRIGLCIYSYL